MFRAKLRTLANLGVVLGTVDAGPAPSADTCGAHAALFLGSAARFAPGFGPAPDHAQGQGHAQDQGGLGPGSGAGQALAPAILTVVLGPGAGGRLLPALFSAAPGAASPSLARRGVRPRPQPGAAPEAAA
ncbi:hypothetical protein [Streptomyces toxytricini]|uniref:hypothetical protein n=1 Tax=Streptomyces toxytricini TaxID=67369 RepID=UPI0034495D70